MFDLCGLWPSPKSVITSGVCCSVVECHSRVSLLILLSINYFTMVITGITDMFMSMAIPFELLQRRHNEHDSVSNHQPHDCLLNRLFRRRSKKTSELRVTGLCVGNSPGPVNSPHKGPVTRKMFPFGDVIMTTDVGFLKLCNFGSAIAHVPGWFCPWTFC